MSSTTLSKPATLGSASAYPSTWSVLLWIAVVGVGAYFVLTEVPRYFIWSEATYGRYFWPRAGYLFPHVLGGLIAILIGPFQFLPFIRTRYPQVHRISGRIYLTSIVVGAFGGMLLAAMSARGLAYASGLFSVAVAWLLTSGMAYISIRRRNFIQHKEWMIRSYVVTFAFVTFRLANDVMVHFGIGERLDRLVLLSWACWAVPLLITELVLQSKQVFAGGVRQGSV